MREAPNLEHTVREIHTINGGSHPLLVSYIFCAGVSYYSWWSITDHSPAQSTWYRNQECGITQHHNIPASINAYNRPKQVRSSKTSQNFTKLTPADGERYISGLLSSLELLKYTEYAGNTCGFVGFVIEYSFTVGPL